MNSVLDASALLAYLRDEPGGDIVEELLEEGCAISAANWAEVLSRLTDEGKTPEEASEDLVERGVLHTSLTVHPLDEAQARRIATLRPITRDAGLSLADRACLALAHALDLPAYTADGAWRDVDAGVPVHFIG
ncbi:MAG: type II toxin-antitoxin system VapC family toxin [Actinomycetota bacterium]|nr:type II toxin-antitoxin system VapC family toxin [Actinomycetota bacterium]